MAVVAGAQIKSQPIAQFSIINYFAHALYKKVRISICSGFVHQKFCLKKVGILKLGFTRKLLDILCRCLHFLFLKYSNCGSRRLPSNYSHCLCS